MPLTDAARLASDQHCMCMCSHVWLVIGYSMSAVRYTTAADIGHVSLVQAVVKRASCSPNT